MYIKTTINSMVTWNREVTDELLYKYIIVFFYFVACEFISFFRWGLERRCGNKLQLLSGDVANISKRCLAELFNCYRLCQVTRAINLKTLRGICVFLKRFFLQQCWLSEIEEIRTFVSRVQHLISLRNGYFAPETSAWAVQTWHSWQCKATKANVVKFKTEV